MNSSLMRLARSASARAAALGHQQPLAIGLRPLTRGRVAALRPDVPEHQDDAEDVPTGITNGRGAVGDLQFPSIAGHEHGLTGRRGVLAGAQDDVRRVQRRLARPLIEDAVDDLERLSDGGLRRPTGQRLRRRVEVGHHAAWIRGDHRVGDTVQRDAEPGLLGRQRRGGALALGDVPRDLRRTDDPAGLVPHRGDRQRDVDAPAVLPHADRLEVIDALAGANAREDHRFLLLPLGRNQREDRPPDQLVRAVAKDALRGGIAGLDDAVQVFREDRILGRVDDGGQIGAGIRFLAARDPFIGLVWHAASRTRMVAWVGVRCKRGTMVTRR